MSARITHISVTGNGPTGRAEGASTEKTTGFMAAPALTKITQRWEHEGTFVRAGSTVERAATKTFHRALVERHG